jgi:hypothetical protein
VNAHNLIHAFQMRKRFHLTLALSSPTIKRKTSRNAPTYFRS